MTTTPSSSFSLQHVVFFPFIAPPGGGKGTQTQRLSEQLGLPRLDMGSLLRSIAKDETSALGGRIRERLNQGLLVEIDIVMDVLLEGIDRYVRDAGIAVDGHSGKLGFILDGFPRNIAQTEALLALCAKRGASIATAIYLDVPYPTIEARAAGRRICADCGAIYNLQSRPPVVPGVCDACGSVHLEHREDDQPEKVSIRLAGFESETLPILERFEAEGLLWRVDGHRAVDTITQELLAGMQAKLGSI